MSTEHATLPRNRRSLRPRAAVICLSVFAALGCGGGDLVLPTDTGPASMNATAGTGQTGTVGKALKDPIAVKVTDRQGQAVSGVRVAFATDGAAGSSVSPDTVVTDAGGLATAQWVLGNTAGSQTATATVVGLSLAEGFTATATSGAARTLALASGDNQNAPAGTGLAEQLVVLVTDEFGNPVPGVEVSWAASTGTVDPASVTTGADGRAATQRVLGPVAGSQQATATAAGLDGSPVTFTHVATAGSASSLTLVSGNNQNGAAGVALAQPLVVRLTDGDGNPIAGSPVSWILGTAGAIVTPSGNTDADGQASATFTLGPVAGATNTVNAVVSGVGVVTFTATAGGGGGGGPGPSDVNSTVSASPSSIQAGSGTSTITVTVLDESGAAVAGASVRLSASGSGNTLTQPAGATAADGTATGTLSSRVPGSKVIRATINNNIEVAQTAEVVVTIAPATTLTLVAGNGQTADAGSAVRVRPQVRVTDALGLPIAGFGVTFVVTGGNGSVTGASQTTNSNGLATVGSWVLGDPGANTLEARAPGLSGSPVVFTAMASDNSGGGDDADHLIFQVPPASPQTEKTNITPTVQVAVVDAAGVVVALSGMDIEVSLTPTNGQLKGHTTRKTVNGVAVFDGLHVDRAGAGYVLTATAPRRPDVAPATSTAFDVSGR